MDHQKELFTTFQKKKGRTDFVLVMFSLCIMKSNLYHFKTWTKYCCPVSSNIQREESDTSFLMGTSTSINKAALFKFQACCIKSTQTFQRAIKSATGKKT
jgi:hypothetical protein